jgi:hypothetical protein
VTTNKKGLITDHSFWEFHSGTSSLFWSDSWQQLPTLIFDPTLRTFIPPMKDASLLKVVDFWILEALRDTWCKWKNTHKDLNIPREIDLQPLLDHLNSRRIFSEQGEEILRWCHTTTETFNIQEPYFLSEGHRSLPKDEV